MSSTMIYCIYSDKEVPEEDSSSEHIMPLSLGGVNDFAIKVDARTNKTLGGKIDGKLSNDFLIQMLRKFYQTKGHSKKSVSARLKNSRIITSNKPIQIDFTGEGLRIYDPRAKRYIERTEYDKIELQSIYKLDGYIRLRFIAKTLLASGYYVYGDLFRQNADHSSLREFMNNGISKFRTPTDKPQLRLYDQFSKLQEADASMMETLKLICSYVNSSCVILGLGPENIFGTVGILGQFIGGINFIVDTRKFPNDDDYRLGHVVYFKDGSVIRKSFYDLVVEMANEMGIVGTET